jgi:hypothetical protein
MRHKISFSKIIGVSNKGSVISSIIASVCIIVYIAAITLAAVRIYTALNERRSLARNEFFDLADLSASAAVRGFMNPDYQKAIQDAMTDSLTLAGVIISGSNGEYAFERSKGAVISWQGESPRFNPGFGVSKEPFNLPLRIEGQRNVNISAVYGYIDYDFFITLLKQTLVTILAALSLAFFTLMFDTLVLKNKTSDLSYKAPPPSGGAQGVRGEDFLDPLNDAVFEEPEESKPEADSDSKGPAENAVPQPLKTPASPAVKTGPQGLYSPRGNIGWEAYTKDRLASELHRCAASEQDLVLIMMRFKDTDKLEPSLFNQFADEAVKFFILRDLIFENGDRGLSVIIPNIDLDQGFVKSEEFHNRILSKLPDSFKSRSDLCIGLSSRSGRLIDADRLLFETDQALEKALQDPVSPIVAFKSDPEKYRAFIASQNKRHP